MKIKLGIVLLVLCVRIAFAQDTSIDTILARIDTEEDDQRKVDLILGIFSPEFEADPNLIIETGWKLLQIAQENEDIMSEATAYSFFGHGYRLAGSNTRSLHYHLQALHLAEKCNHPTILALVKIQMAHIYKDREEKNKAIQLYLSAEKHAIEGNNEILQVWAMMNAGATYLNAGMLDSALICLQTAYQQSIRLNYDSQLAYILTNLGGVQSKLGNPALASTYHHMAIQQALTNNSKRYENLAYTALAEHFNRVQQNDSCIWYSRKAVGVVENSVFSYLGLKPARILTEMYQYSNCDSTLKYAKIVKLANDSIFNRQSNQQIMLMTVEEDLRQREALLKIEQEEHQRQLNIQYALLALGIILLVSLFLLLSQRFITNPKFIHFFSIVALLLVFEFLNLVLHPLMAKLTNHTPVLMLLGLVSIAAILVPLHHRLEQWASVKLVEKNKQVRLAMAKRTIEKLSEEGKGE